MSEIIILSPTEERIGDFNRDEVEIIERNELNGLREIEIKYPLSGDTENVSKYVKLLKNGNKIWQQRNCDGESILYVLNKNIIINPGENLLQAVAQEIIIELTHLETIQRTDTEKIIINKEHLQKIVRNLFKIKEIPENITYKLNGVYTPLGILKEIEKQTKHEFEYMYKLINNKIERIINLKKYKGKNHTTIIEIGQNTDNILLSIDESDYAIGAAPIGYSNKKKKKNTKDEFQKSITAFTKLKIMKNELILKDGSNKELGKVKAPLTKKTGERFVLKEPGNDGNYTHIISPQDNKKHPRLISFEVNPKNEYDIYWECVRIIKEHENPKINIECNITNLKRLNNSYEYNVGDFITLKLPYQKTKVKARIIKTEKNNKKRENDQIEIGNYKTKYSDKYIEKITNPLIEGI